MDIQRIQFGNYSLGALQLSKDAHIYITCTSLRNHWMRARRLDRVAFEKALIEYQLPIFGVACISIVDLKNLLSTLMTRYDVTARAMMVSYLDKCFASVKEY